MQPSERRNPLARRQDEEIALAGDGNGQKELPISLIRRDGQTQPRDGMSEDVVTDYVAALADGVQFPPVDVMFDGTHYWLFDGFHRVETYLRSGRTAISARCYDGTLEEAQWRSYAANKSHGLRRSTADKERAIRAALRHTNAVSKSDREIAKHLGVDHKTIGKYRAEMQVTGEIPQSTERTGADGRTIDTVNIGKRPKPAPPPPAPTARPLTDEETRHLVWRTIKAENEIAPGASSLFKWRKYLDWLGKHGEARHYTIGLAAGVRIDAITLATIIAAVATEISNNMAAVRVNEAPAVVEIANEESPTVEAAVSELVELPADLIERGWVLRQMAASGRWWCHNANGSRATGVFDTVAEAATAARGMQIDVTKPPAKPAGGDEVTVALQRIEEAVADLVERLGLDMLRVRLDERQGNPWSLLASKAGHEINWANDNIVGVSSALVNLGRKGAK